MKLVVGPGELLPLPLTVRFEGWAEARSHDQELSLQAIRKPAPWPACHCLILARFAASRVSLTSEL